MPVLEDKKIYFDQYWREQPAEIADPRAYQRAEYIYRLLGQKSGTLFDAGCGRGVALDYFAECGYDVSGADISPLMVANLVQEGYNVCLADLEKGNPPGKYNIVLCLEVLQQLYDPLAAILKLKEALHADGELVVSVPNEFHIVSRLRLLFGRSHLGRYDHSHIRLFAPARDRSLFERAGLQIAESARVSIVPPRWKVISAVFHPLAQLLPSLFALSSIYILRKK
jgi:2-polyprenyl-3-methyl-5-hydroxy-6-metoxy-1,4-benzoquinol methylase